MWAERPCRRPPSAAPGSGSITAWRTTARPPLRSPEPTVDQAQTQAQPQTQPQGQAQPQGGAPEEERVPAPEELYKAFYELQGIQDAIAKADPKWMLSSSEAYGKMRKGIEGTIKFVLKNRQTFSSTPDPDSPEYKKAAKEFMRRLRASKGQASAYLDKKVGELEKDSGRKEDADRQKWEQQRIRAALNSYEKLSRLTSGGAEKDAAEDPKAVLYRQTLLSENSRAILAEENRERPPAPCAEPPSPAETEGFCGVVMCRILPQALPLPKGARGRMHSASPERGGCNLSAPACAPGHLPFQGRRMAAVFP